MYPGRRSCCRETARRRSIADYTANFGWRAKGRDPLTRSGKRSGSATRVTMVEATDLRDRDDVATVGWLDFTGVRSILLQREVRT